MENKASENILLFSKESSIYNQSLKRFKDALDVHFEVEYHDKWLFARILSKYLDRDNKTFLYTADVWVNNDFIFNNRNDTYSIDRDKFIVYMKNLKKQLMERTGSRSSFSYCNTVGENKLDDFDFFDGERNDVEVNDNRCVICYKNTINIVSCCKAHICRVCLNNTSVARKKSDEELLTICPHCRTDHNQIDDNDDGFWKIEDDDNYDGSY